LSPSDQISRLERLLARVQKNASAPRAARTVQVAAPVAVAPAAAPPPRPSEDEAPIPLVAVARAPEEVSSVRVAPAAPAVEVSPEPAEELTEDDLVEINSVPPPAVAEAPPVVEAAPPIVESVPAPPADDIDFDDEEEEEQPPASSKRSKVPTTMDEALAAAAAQLGAEEHEVPIKTPPPESGPQEAVPLPAGLAPAPVPDVDDMLEADLPPAHGPRPEQLGQTIDLEEARGPALELDLGRKATPAPVQETSELEAPLPAREADRGYDANLAPPAEAKQDLQAFVRPALPAAEVASFVGSAGGFQPKSFIELLDASIDLGKS
jgi:hypothetical protein